MLFLEIFNGGTSYRLVNWSIDFDFQLHRDSAINANIRSGADSYPHWAQ